MGDAFTKLVTALADWTGQRTESGKTGGWIIIATLLFVWAYITVKTKAWIDPGVTWGVLLFAIYVFLSRRPPAPPMNLTPQ